MVNEPGSKINAVLFDYGMVLSGPPDPVARQRMERILNVSEKSLQGAYWKYREDYDRGSLSGPAYWRSVAKDVDQTLDDASLNALIEADIALWTQPNLPMIDWARRLQRAGIKTGILSNIGDAMEDGIRTRFPWLDEFTHHTFSHRLGITKPDPAIYQHAAEGLGVPPAAILFIDDKEENVRAAQSAGMSALQYSDQGSFAQTMERLGLGALLACQG